MIRRFLGTFLAVVILCCCTAPCIADQLTGGTPAAQHQTVVAHWPFDGELSDRTGHGNDVYVTAPKFIEGHRGSALSSGRVAAVASDSSDLRLAPGMRFDCWVKFTELPAGGQEILVKGHEYMLRVDPAREGGQFALFVYLDDWEPRIRSAVVPQIGTWYHLVVGWDGQILSLNVNGNVVRGRRVGQPATNREPLRFGPFFGVIDEVQLENPNAKLAGVAYWPFDGTLRDGSGHGHDGVAEGVKFSPGRVGQALGADSGLVRIPNSPDLQVAPGLRIDCLVYFEKVPTGIQNLVTKDGEYMLRVDPPQEGSDLAFFVNINGWEPRVRTNIRVRAGTWYRIIAQWDGLALTLEVNGVKAHLIRSGLCRPTDSPLTIGGPGMLLDELRIENPKLPVVRIGHVTQEHAIMRAGIPETLTAVVQNLGQEVTGVTVGLALQPSVRCLGTSMHELGTLATGTTKTIQWQVVAERESSGYAAVRLACQGARPTTTRRPLAFFPRDDAAAARMAKMVPPGRGGQRAVTYYIDSVQGNNANGGTSPAAPWRDFTNVNGKTLGAGEKLLIKRGSSINQELSISARGAVDNWAEVGAYGTGPRPIIRRNWDIDDRCALVHDPDYLRIGSLVVCYAGKGLVVHYRRAGHSGLIIEDCIAHHIEGLYRPNANGIPEWRGRNGAGGDDLHSSAGVALTGARVKNVVIRNCEMFQTSWGFFVRGDGVILDRLYCHDNYVRNTSPHPALVGAARSYLQNSIFDSPGWHASAGTMGIMLGDPEGLIIRNCTFRNQPDSGSHDEGGIDFENSGNGCLIDHCTFQNNAGAAIEVLGLRAPQTRNVEIANSRFLANNTAHKLGPAEIYIWGKAPSPEVCCSTGSIHDNGYVTVPGVKFFVNEAPKTTLWTLRDNTAYTTVADADKAMPFNGPPTVDAGPDIRTDQTTIHLTGSVHDDDRSGAGALTVRWEVLEGAGAVSFRDATSPETAAKLSTPGDYLLRLVADDGQLWSSDMVTVHILPPSVSVATAWEFNKPLNKEGWTEGDLGTQVRHWTNQSWSTTSHPVKYVAGGYYIVAIENSSDAHLLSAANLAVDLTNHKTLRIRFQNHTPATRMRFRFATEANPKWQDANSKFFDVIPNDTRSRQYAVDMTGVPSWTGRLKQLRLDLASGAAVTGTVRIDYLWICN